MKRQPIVIVGCGPGHPDYLFPTAQREIEQAEVLVGAPHLLQLFPAVGQLRIAAKGGMTEALEQMEDLTNRRIVVLVSGDSGFYSLARMVIARFGRGNCRVIPGISSLQLAFSRLALEWSDALTLSAHGRIPQVADEVLDHFDKIAVLAGTREAIEWCADLLNRRGPDYLLVACEDLTLDSERIRHFVSADALLATEFASRTILILLKKDHLL